MQYNLEKNVTLQHIYIFNHPYFVVRSFMDKFIGLKGVKEMALVLLLLIYCSRHISTSFAC